MAKEATAKVTPFPEKESEAKDQPIVQTPAIGASIAINIGGDRQLTLQAFFERDADESEANRVLDKMRCLANRQKAFADIERLAKELADHRKALKRFEEDLDRAESEHAEKVQAREDEIAALTKKATEIHDAAYARFTSSGKQAGFELRGGDKSAVERIKSDIGKASTEIAKLANERTQYIGQLEKNQERYREEIAIRERELAAAEALIA